MLLKTFIVLAVLLAGFLIYVATRPAAFRYTRGLAINAAPETLFPHINDLRQFQEWNPWAKAEPDIKLTYSGPGSGPGSSYDWTGKKTGEGTMTITESQPNQLVRARMDFRKPFTATHTAEFTLKPEGSQTLVTWSLYGDNNFLGKLFGVLMNGDKMCGDQFEQGLAALKDIVEAPGGQSALRAEP